MGYLLKKILVKLLLLLLVVVIPITTYIFIKDDVQLAWNINTIKEMDKYTIHAEFFPEQEKLSVLEKIEYINKTGVRIDKMLFYINDIISSYNLPYQNIREEKHNEADRLPFKVGEIEYVKVGNKKADFKIIGKRNSILMVNLHKELAEEDKVNIEVKYELNTSHLISTTDKGTIKYMLRNWYPSVAPYNNGWELEPSHRNSELHEDASYFVVDVVVPEGYEVESESRLIEKIKVKDKYHFKLQDQGTLSFNVNIISTKK